MEGLDSAGRSAGPGSLWNYDKTLLAHLGVGRSTLSSPRELEKKLRETGLKTFFSSVSVISEERDFAGIRKEINKITFTMKTVDKVKNTPKSFWKGLKGDSCPEYTRIPHQTALKQYFLERSDQVESERNFSQEELRHLGTQGKIITMYVDREGKMMHIVFPNIYATTPISKGYNIGRTINFITKKPHSLDTREADWKTFHEEGTQERIRRMQKEAADLGRETTTLEQTKKTKLQEKTQKEGERTVQEEKRDRLTKEIAELEKEIADLRKTSEQAKENREKEFTFIKPMKQAKEDALKQLNPNDLFQNAKLLIEISHLVDAFTTTIEEKRSLVEKYKTTYCTNQGAIKTKQGFNETKEREKKETIDVITKLTTSIEEKEKEIKECTEQITAKTERKTLLEGTIANQQ